MLRFWIKSLAKRLKKAFWLNFVLENKLQAQELKKAYKNVSFHKILFIIL